VPYCTSCATFPLSAYRRGIQYGTFPHQGSPPSPGRHFIISSSSRITGVTGVPIGSTCAKAAIGLVTLRAKRTSGHTGGGGGAVGLCSPCLRRWGGCAGGGVPLGAVSVLSWCGEVSLGGKQSSPSEGQGHPPPGGLLHIIISSTITGITVGS